MARDELSRGPYAMSDGVTDDEFEEALDQAKAEGNLSRANVVRRVKGEARVNRWAKLEELATTGAAEGKLHQPQGSTPAALNIST